VLILHSALGGS